MNKHIKEQRNEQKLCWEWVKIPSQTTIVKGTNIMHEVGVLYKIKIGPRWVRREREREREGGTREQTCDRWNVVILTVFLFVTDIIQPFNNDVFTPTLPVSLSLSLTLVCLCLTFRSLYLFLLGVEHFQHPFILFTQTQRWDVPGRGREWDEKMFNPKKKIKICSNFVSWTLSTHNIQKSFLLSLSFAHRTIPKVFDSTVLVFVSFQCSRVFFIKKI